MGAVPDIPENYPNVKMILDELNMEAVEYTMSIDIKMRKYEYLFDNMVLLISVLSYLEIICVGKSSGKPKFGCPFCSSCSPYLEEGELYTLGDLIQLHQVFFLNILYS